MCPPNSPDLNPYVLILITVHATSGDPKAVVRLTAMNTQQQHQHPAGDPRLGAKVAPEMRSPRGNDQWKKPSMAEEDALQREELRRRRVEVCKTVAKDVAKKAILYGVMAIYTVLGGYAFVALEQTNERELCSANENLYEKMELDAAQSLWKMSRSYPDPDEQESQRVLIQGQMEAFRNNVMTLNYDGRNCSMLGTSNGTAYNWNFPAALLFSVTVFTTVGYGNITPVTTWGRLVCIAYAMIGIPLMFVCLASIGEILGDVFRFVYFKICCLGACQRRRPRCLQGSSAAASSPRTSADDPQQQHPTPDGGNDSWRKRLIEDDADDEEEGDEDEMSIPITVTLLVIAGYIGLGTIMFANWEGWDPLQAAYYCFITVSTIGFGDIVPGFSPNDSSTGLKMIVAALYLLFGMSLMSMGFDLIQYEMKNRVPSRSARSACSKDEPSSTAPPSGPPGNRGLPQTGQPAWPDANRAPEAMSGGAFEMTDPFSGGIKKRGFNAGMNELGLAGTMPQYQPAAAAKLDLKSADKIA